LIRGYSLQLKYSFFTVTVSEVVSYLYCPRKLLLIRTLGLKDKPLEETLEGVQAHIIYEKLTLFYMKTKESKDYWKLVSELEEKENFPEIRKLAEFRYSNPFTSAQVEVPVEIQGIKGRIDIIEDKTPIEIKYRNKLLERDVVQVTWYTLLAEAALNKNIDYAYIDLLKIPKRIKIHIDNEKRIKALKTREKCIKTIIQNNYTLKRKNCRKCPLRKECKLLNLT